VRAAYESLLDCDVIHDHTLTGPLWACTLAERPPVLATHHGEFSDPARRFFAHVAPHVVVNGISHDQVSHAAGVPVAGVVHHGLDLERFSVGEGKGGYVLFVGRCSPDKGVAEAIEIARAADMPIVVVAKKREGAELRYFEERVAPLLGPGVEYLGEVHPGERDRLMRDAVALVNPIKWHEPFGLVMVESLASGTPVVAFRSGAAPEIVDEGVTGFLCDDQDAAVTALGKVADLERWDCRAAVEKRFTAERMVTDYLRIYDGLATRELTPS
jgi:glycosyltransferase involved in cell wall biosynthesis